MRLVVVGFGCNNACVFCAQGDLRSAEGRDAQGRPDDVDAAIAALAPGEVIAFTGGEPTLDDRLPEWIRAAHERGASRVFVQTNGRRLAYRAYAAALAAASPRLELDVSLHGSTEAMHDWHTQAPGSFKQTLLGLRSARAEGVPAAITTVVTRSNFRHLDEIARVAHAASARAIRFALAERHGRAARDADRVVPAPELVAPHLRRAIAEAERLGLGVVAFDRARPESARDRFVGLGVVETVSLEPRMGGATASGHDGRRRLPLAASRPKPGRTEERARERRTGADLAALFPDLFRAASLPAPIPAAALGPASARHVDAAALARSAERAGGGE